MADGVAKGRRRRAQFALSRLTVTIVIANLIGLVILLVGSFALTQYRDGLIQAKLEGVRAQAQIVSRFSCGCTRRASETRTVPDAISA